MKIVDNRSNTELTTLDQILPGTCFWFSHRTQTPENLCLRITGGYVSIMKGINYANTGYNSKVIPVKTSLSIDT